MLHEQKDRLSEIAGIDLPLRSTRRRWTDVEILMTMLLFLLVIASSPTAYFMATGEIYEDLLSAASDALVLAVFPAGLIALALFKKKITP